MVLPNSILEYITIELSWGVLVGNLDDQVRDSQGSPNLPNPVYSPRHKTLLTVDLGTNVMQSILKTVTRLEDFLKSIDFQTFFLPHRKTFWVIF